MALQDQALAYFSAMNSISARICTDLNETKTAYEELWQTIPEKEQQQILSEAIITPEISIKYRQNEARSPTSQDFALKRIHDDHCSYRDEHSAPFSFKTRSQHDLRLFQVAQESIRTNRPVLKTKPKVQKIVNVFMEQQQEAEENGADLPKTGLDLLDNW